MKTIHTRPICITARLNTRGLWILLLAILPFLGKAQTRPGGLQKPVISARANMNIPGIGVAQGAASLTGLGDGPGGPILVINSSGNPFSSYTAEILRAEGWNEFASADISTVNAALLANYDVAILGNVSLTAGQVTDLTTFVTNGGTLIAFRPDAQLASLLGLTSASSTLSEGYIFVDGSKPGGSGIVQQSMQYHGTADLYTVTGGSTTVVATLMSDATTPTAYPAVVSTNVGSSGGQAVAFLYDLCRSIIYTHQGNPAWVGQKRDATPEANTRSDDLFYPDYVNHDKIAIPQADEQQRLLSNLIHEGNKDKKPLPRFWFLPKGKKAAIVMTGDDHSEGRSRAVVNRFNDYVTASPGNTATDVTNWDAVRATSYMYPLRQPTNPITDAEVASFQNAGFEFAVHPDLDCSVFGRTAAYWTSIFNYYGGLLNGTITSPGYNYLPSINAYTTNRTHCVYWINWTDEVEAEIAKGVRLDANYYYYPSSFVSYPSTPAAGNDKPGLFTGTGHPMRFAKLDGTMLDCYQLTTQLLDNYENGATYPKQVTALLDSAIGTAGYYGVFGANMHTDIYPSTASDQIVTAALARGVPVVSAKQMLTWLDARNNSSFTINSWASNQLNFTITKDANANNLKAMVPATIPGATLLSVTLGGTPVTTSTQTIKGVDYAFFDAVGGTFVATYAAVTPVEQLFFKATAEKNDAKLEWATASESKNKGFEVQRSKDRQSWTSVTFVQGAGNSSVRTDYAYTDAGLEPGKYYYRLRQVDLDGRSSLSEVVSVNILVAGAYKLNQNYPNPASGKTSIGYSLPNATVVNLSVYDQFGRLVKVLVNEQRSSGSHSVELDTRVLARGIYFYRMRAGDHLETRKMIVE